MAGEVPYLVLAEGRSGERQLGAALAVVQRPRGQRRRRRPAARRRSEAWKGGESAQRFEGRASSLPEGSSLRAEVPGIGIARWAPPVTVAIALANRARPGMKRRQRSRSGEDPHAARQRQLAQRAQLDGLPDRKRSDLATRVDAGIRPCGPVDLYPLAEQGGERILQDALDRLPARLPLPARKPGPPVAERQRVRLALHRPPTSGQAANVAMASAGKSVFGQTAAGGQDTRGPCQASFSGTTCITSLCFGAKGW